MRIQGYGYEWNAFLNGGPADGCVDRVIQIKGEDPPKFIMRILDGEEIKRESIGEKLIELFAANSIDKNQKVAAYELKNVKDGDCFYEYIETIIYKEYSKKYTDLF